MVFLEGNFLTLSKISFQNNNDKVYRNKTMILRKFLFKNLLKNIYNFSGNNCHLNANHSFIHEEFKKKQLKAK